VLLLTGCGEAERRQDGPRAVFPALNVSPPPPMLPAEEPSGSKPQPVAPAAPPAAIAEEGWVQRQVRKEEQIKQLRAYAASADPDDPFAMTGERIKALEAGDDFEFQ
jgi:hypothetical protein